MNQLLYPILLPFLIGLACLIAPRKARGVAGFLSLAASACVFVLVYKLFLLPKPQIWVYQGVLMLRMDNLSAFIVFFVGLFGVLAVLYSVGFMKHNGAGHINLYYTYILWTIGASIGAALSNNMIVFVTFWGFLAITLYLLIGLGKKERAPETARKTFVIVGGSDAFILLGIGIIWYAAKSLDMSSLKLSVSNGLGALAYISLAIGAFAKAGVMPFHTWVPDASEDSPTPVAAFIPACLDKLLGIYFLARISLDIFVLDNAMRTFLMAIGSFTIIAAVMMALMQHDFKRLLGYHAVSQAGYMVLGIGTGSPVGIIGGLFHMLNNAIYKNGLFLTSGAIEKKAGTTDLEKLGGISRVMPISFATCLIASLAISGVPPFNGFFSKWMIYQGVIELGKRGGGLWVLWLIAAVFGSALTLASFMKLIHAAFLGQKSREMPRVPDRDVGGAMWVPMAVLAALSILFGVFGSIIPLKIFVTPSVDRTVSYPGLWSAGPATILTLVGVALGFIIYLLGNIKASRTSDTFVGGESVEKVCEMRVSGVEFYGTVKDIGILKFLYRRAEEKFFDIYDQGKNTVFFFTRIFRRLHNGVLSTYLVWCMIGLIAIFFVLMMR